MFDRLVADGDRTTTGGEVIGRSGMYNEDGRMYARKENHATCGNCKGSWPISGTADDWLDDGYPMVKDLDWVMCPCRNNRVLAASSSNALWTGNTVEASSAPPSKALTYDQQYTLKDGTGRPLAGLRYRIVVDEERAITGTTDASGKTERVRTDAASTLKLYATGAIGNE
ncbi:PAAR domain-containing protein [Paraburkholderia pallida]|uniref:PAAR domain-containing protein n=1 Tax=Paraburkholderia pallida TaxID=2547399 RepID=A0A4P7CQS3_9BURK|nr:PAAR domain-containing protein [Paraburkholderia pallida]QBQ98228.1 hypothetical protein E1956_14305 [Paraburkholderia pallida]